MPPWLQPALDPDTPPSWSMLGLRLGLAVLFGVLVAWVYRWSRPQTVDNRSFPGTLLLLCVLIAMLTQVIGDSVARAFSLVGALSIVRFRTVVQDTQDTAFVIFAVAIGMAIGAGQPAVAVAGTVAVGIAAALLRERRLRHEAGVLLQHYRLEVRLGWSKEAETALKEILAAHGADVRLSGGGTARQGSAMNLAFDVDLPDGADLTRLIAELNKVDSVQSIEFQRHAPE
jgi:uncharacterized membrane protein YhiD involved in acid resistance